MTRQFFALLLGVVSALVLLAWIFYVASEALTQWLMKGQKR